MRVRWVGICAMAAYAAVAPPLLSTLSLKEHIADVRRLFREEPHSKTTPGEVILQFHGSDHSHGCDDSRQWVFYFSRAENRLISVTRNLDTSAAVETLIPRSARLASYETPQGYPVMRAFMADGREFVIPGARGRKDRVSQIQLVRTPDVVRFYQDLRPAR